MPTGHKWYYILRRVKSVGGWINYAYVRVGPATLVEARFGALPRQLTFVGTRIEATPYPTKDAADAEAFLIAATNPDLMGCLEVRLESLP